MIDTMVRYQFWVTAVNAYTQESINFPVAVECPTSWSSEAIENQARDHAVMIARHMMGGSPVVISNLEWPK